MGNSQKSITWINTYKALCILAVFFAHSQLYYSRTEFDWLLFYERSTAYYAQHGNS